MLVAYIVWQLMMLLLPGFRRDMGELLGPSPDGHVPSSVPLIGGSSLSSLAVWTVSSALLALPALLGAVELIGDLERYNVLATWARGRDPYHGMDWPPRDPIERVYYNRRLYKCLSRLTPWDCHQVSIQLAAAYRQPRRALPPNETLSS
jgi:hypothetical protein